MVKELSIGKMEEYILEIGVIIKWMVMEFLFGLIRKNIMVIIVIIQKKDMDAFIGMMVINMKDFGKKENKMDMV